MSMKKKFEFSFEDRHLSFTTYPLPETERSWAITYGNGVHFYLGTDTPDSVLVQYLIRLAAAVKQHLTDRDGLLNEDMSPLVNIRSVPSGKLVQLVNEITACLVDTKCESKPIGDGVTLNTPYPGAFRFRGHDLFCEFITVPVQGHWDWGFGATGTRENYSVAAPPQDKFEFLTELYALISAYSDRGVIGLAHVDAPGLETVGEVGLRRLKEQLKRGLSRIQAPEAKSPTPVSESVSSTKLPLDNATFHFCGRSVVCVCSEISDGVCYTWRVMASELNEDFAIETASDDKLPFLEKLYEAVLTYQNGGISGMAMRGASGVETIGPLYLELLQMQLKQRLAQNVLTQEEQKDTPVQEEQKGGTVASDKTSLLLKAMVENGSLTYDLGYCSLSFNPVEDVWTVHYVAVATRTDHSVTGTLYEMMAFVIQRFW